MTKRLGFFAVVSLWAVGCGGTEAELQTEAAESSAPARGTVSAQAYVTVYNQSFTPTCATRDVWKLNTAFFCPSGTVGVAVTAHDPCTTAGTYRFADITCRPRNGGAESVLANQPPPPTCSTYDDFKQNTGSFCPPGSYGSSIVTHDACSTPGTYRYADITCYQP